MLLGRERIALVLQNVALAGLCYVGARLGGLFDPVSGYPSLVWIPSGLSLAGVILFGHRLWPGVALGAFLASVGVGAPPGVAVGIAAGSTIAALVAAYSLRRFGYHGSLDRLRDVVALAVLAAGASTLISATVGVASLWLGGLVTAEELAPTWFAWWWGDVAGDLIVAPLLLTSTAEYPRSVSDSWHSQGEPAVLALLLVLICALVFFGPVPTFLRHIGMPYLIFPPLLWAGSRFGPRGAAVASLVVNAFAISALALGRGPLVSEVMPESVADLQSFMAVSALVTLSIGATSSERSRHLASARQAELRKSAILEAALDGIVTMNHEGKLCELNAAAEKLFGVTREEAVGRDMASLIIPPSLRRAHRRALSRYLRTGEAHVLGRRMHFQARRSDGTEFPAEITVARVAAESPPLFTAFVRDMTAQKGTEAALEKSQGMLEQTAKFQRFVDAAPDAIVIIDRQGTVVLANTQTERLFGYRGAELVGKTVEVLVPERFRERHVGHRARYLAEPTRRPMGPGLELYGLRKDSTEFPVEISLAPIDTEEGLLISAAIRDITERKVFDERLRSSLKEKDVLLREIHHRVKNNLQVIASLLNLQASEVTSEEARAGFEDSQSRIQSMALVHQLLYQSADLASIDFTEYLRQLVDRLAKSYGVGLNETSISVNGSNIRLDIDTSVPCGLIVNELVSNSLKHAFPDGRQGHVEVSFESDGEGDGGFLLVVSDDGIGIPETVHLETVRTLGLQIVRSLANQLHGRVEVVRCGGTTFRIRFGSPVARDQPREA